MRFYIYKLIFKSGSTYIGEHLEKIPNDGYITSSKYYKENKFSDPLVERKILIEVNDEETMHFMETVCIMQDKRDNPKNVNGTLGSFVFKFSSYRGKYVTDKTRQKCSEASKKRIITEETRKKISSAQKGISESEETKRAMSERMKGNQCRRGTKTSEIGKQHIKEAVKQRIANGWISPLKGKPGRKHTPEELEKMSKASKNRVHKRGYSINFKNAEKRAKKISDSLKGKHLHSQSEESRKIISKKLKGIKRSEETKKRMSEANKGKVYVTNETLVKRLSKEEAELFLKEHTDWRYGNRKRRNNA